MRLLRPRRTIAWSSAMTSRKGFLYACHWKAYVNLGAATHFALHAHRSLEFQHAFFHASDPESLPACSGIDSNPVIAYQDFQAGRLAGQGDQNVRSTGM